MEKMEVEFEIEVKVALIKNKSTQANLAKELGISSAYLSDILKGNRKADKHREQIKTLLDLS